MGFFKLHFAIFFDENGENITTKNIPKDDKKFKFKDKTYNINRKKASYYEKKGLIYNKRYYFYNIGCPDPFKLVKPPQAKIIMDPEQYNTILETKVIKDLNTVKFNILDKLNAKIVIFSLAVIGIIGYIIYNGGIS